jgi:hypothetical protein
MPLPRTFHALALLVAAGCGSTSDLGPASDANVVDTTTLYALEGTPITQPSGFSLPERNPVRTDQTTAFDFAFNIDDEGQAVFLPLAVLGLGGSSANPGLLPTTTPFDSIVRAERDGFTTDDTVAVAVGTTLLGRSRVVCSSLGVPQYGKFEVLEVNPVERSVTLQFLVNINCGYIGLEPGIPLE